MSISDPQARLFIAISSSPPSSAGALFAAESAAARLKAADDVLGEIMSAPDKGIPQDLLGKSQCIVIVPGLKKGAFIVGGKYGRGFILCRESLRQRLVGPGWRHRRRRQFRLSDRRPGNRRGDARDEQARRGKASFEQVHARAETLPSRRAPSAARLPRIPILKCRPRFLRIRARAACSRASR